MMRRDTEELFGARDGAGRAAERAGTCFRRSESECGTGGTAERHLEEE